MTRHVIASCHFNAGGRRGDGYDYVRIYFDDDSYEDKRCYCAANMRARGVKVFESDVLGDDGRWHAKAGSGDG